MMFSPLTKSLRRFVRTGRSTKPAAARRRNLNLERLEARDVPATWRALTNQMPSNSGGAESMILMTDGSVLIQGGFDEATSSWYKLTPDATGNYVNGTITQVASMGLERLFFASKVLPSGKLFVLGGEYSGPLSSINWVNTGEIYDPVANTWAPIANFPQSQFGDDPSAVLANGTVLAGYLSGAQTYIYDPSANTWKSAGTRLRGEVSDEEGYTTLPGGDILSYDIFSSVNTGNGTAQKYVPSTGKWIGAGTVPVPLSSSSLGYELGPAMLLPDGRVFQIGANSNTALYDPTTNTWKAGPVTPNGLGADDAPGAVLVNGHVLYAADTPESDLSNAAPPTALFDFDPTTNSITPVTSANTTFPASLTNALASEPSFEFRMLDLPNGDVLMCSGSRQIWEYTPDGTPSAAWRPTVSSITFNGNNTYTLTGTQLTGMTEGATYGDDAEMSTNFPIVRLTSNAGAVYYARTFNWTPGVQTGSAVVSTQFNLPANLPAGTYTLNVVANGIASVGVPFPPGFYADTHWAGLPDGTAITDIDPVAPGNQPGVVGTNAFGSVDAAIAASSVGGLVIVNGDDGSGQYGNFSESVALDKQIRLVIQGGPVSFGSLSGTAANATISTGVVLTVGGDNTSTEFDGAVSGTGSLAKAGTGTFILGGANTYTGGTFVNAGTLQVGNGGMAGAIAGTATNNATLAFNRSNNYTFAGTINGSGTTVNLGTATLTGTISGGQSITEQSTGTLTLTSFNLFTGPVTVVSGTLKLGSSHALGAITNAVQVNTAGTLDLAGLSPTVGTLTDNGTIANSAGGPPVVTLSAPNKYDLQLFGTSSVASGVTFQFASAPGGVQLGADLPTNTLTGVTFDFGGTAGEINVGAGSQWNLANSQTANGGFTLTGGGTLSLRGATASTNTAAITVAAGTLDLAKTAGVNAVAGDVVLAGGTLHLTNGNQIADTSTVTVNSGTFDLGGQAETIAALAGAGGQVSLTGASVLTIGGSGSSGYSGPVTGAGGLTMAGTGTFTLSGTDTYTGPTTVDAGILLVNGSLANTGTVAVAAGSTLGGSGSVGATAVSGVLSPGNGVGVFTTTSLSFGSGGTLTVPLNGATPSTGYSQVVATGAVNLTGATLVLPIATGFNPAVGTTFDILVNNSGSSITGTFAGLAEGSTFMASGQNFRITYHGGASGNDVVLTRASAVPPPTVAGVQVNDGSAQRSEVRSISITFSGPVSFAGGNANAAAAFQLQHVQTGNNVTLSAAVTTDGQNRTVVTLSFTGGETDAVSALHGGAPSLADGRYQLTILGSAVTDATGQALDGAGTGTAGSNYVSPADTFGGTGLHLYRLFGDASGDGVVDVTDLGQFRSTFNANNSQANYLAYLDADNSGAVDVSDLAQLRARFNANVF